MPSTIPNGPTNAVLFFSGELESIFWPELCSESFTSSSSFYSLFSNAGIYATASVISEQRGESDLMNTELDLFLSGLDACKPINFNKHGSDEVLVGRAGYLSGVYWLNENLHDKPIKTNQIQAICESILTSGREYSQRNRSALPLMYEYHGSEYLGAAHGVCAILLVLLQSPALQTDGPAGQEIKQSIDKFLGKFPSKYFLIPNAQLLMHTFQTFPNSPPRRPRQLSHRTGRPAREAARPLVPRSTRSHLPLCQGVPGVPGGQVLEGL